jgi:hypothetical protein
MSDFNVRSDSVDVEQIMRQIRTRIREKRGADYTEAELQQLASVKLEKFLDPRGLRSDLVEQFRRHRIVSPEPPKYEFEDTTMYDTHRGVLRFMRRVLHPILKLFINPNPLIHAMHVQAQINAEFHRRFREREEMDPLFYEVIHNLVLEVTRLGIENHNLKMRVESLSSRMDFDERRGRALESVVQYRPGATARPANVPPPAGAPEPPAMAPRPDQPGPDGGGRPDGPRPEGMRQDGSAMSGERRRRRRRRRRRPGQTMGDRQGPGQGQGAPGFEHASPGGGPHAAADPQAHDDHGHDEGGDDGADLGDEAPEE